ncbi:MAG: PAS domain-containing protein [Deltaproteobacteria bacterium]|nr:PAS domain-containing protein [Deltaproteobacteria bacterium]
MTDAGSEAFRPLPHYFQTLLRHTRSACVAIAPGFRLLWHSPHLESLFPHFVPGYGRCYELFNREAPCSPCPYVHPGRISSVSDFEESGRYGSTERAFHLTCLPSRSATGEIVAMVDYIRDVTAEKEALREHGKLSVFHEKIVTHAPVGIFTLDRHGIITTTNPAHLKIAGNPPPQLVLGMDWLNAPAVKAAGLDYYLAKGLAGEPFEVSDVSYTTQLTGRHLYMTVRGVPLKARDNTVEGLICIIEDTTDKTQYLRQLERIQAYDEHILESITTGIAVLDPEYGLRTVNTGMAALLRAPKEELIGSDLRRRLRFLGGDEAALALERVFQSGLATDFAKLHLSGEGVHASINYRVLPLLDDRRHQYGAILFMEDVTEREKVERELEAQLLQASKMSALGGMAAGVAHEINNPLATIAACAEEVLDLIEESPDVMARGLNGTIRPLVRLIQEQSFRCKQITNDLLDFARLKQPTVTLVDLNQVVERVVSLSGLVDGSARARIRVSLDERLPAVRGDESQMEQVFVNLLNNAFDAIGEAGKIEISTSRVGSEVRVAVRDDGVGMSSEQLEKIFHPFFTTKPPNKGTGLGLSICYRIVERFGGTIEVCSEEKRGTTFTLTFPACEA